MLKLTKTGIGLLTRQYRSVLKKCLLINLGVFTFSTPSYGGDLSAGSYVIGNHGGESAYVENYIYIQGMYMAGSLSGNTVYFDFEQYLHDISHRLVGNAVAFGDSATSTGDYGIAIGQGATASSNYGIAIGGGSNGTKASGYAGVAVGVLATAASELSVAIGHNAGVLAQSYRGTALGGNSSASANYAVALGAESQATEAYTVSVGKSDLKRRITNVAAGSAANDAVIISQLGFDIATYPTVANYVSNNYYRKEDLGSRQVIDFTRYFKTGKFGENARFLGVVNDNFATNLTSKIGGFATNHPPRLGAFAKCEKACSRLSERFIQAMRENRAFEDIASADAGTFLFVSQTHKNVLDSFSQTVANINVVNDNFTVETNTVAA